MTAEKASGQLQGRTDGKTARARARATEWPAGIGRFLDVYRDARLLPYSREDSEVMAALEHCLNCGTCLGVCPVVGAASVRAAEPYPGPRAVGTSLSRSPAEFWSAADITSLCTTCMACEEACPGDVPAYRAILMMRAKNFEESALEGREPLARLKQLVVDFFAGGKLAEAAHWAATLQGLAFKKTSSGEMKARIPIPLGPVGRRVVPPLARRSLAAEFPEVVRGEDPRGPRVAVFAGCLYNHAYTDTGRSLVEVLARHCREVVVPGDQACCGAPVLYAGDLPSSRRLAAKNAEVFAAAHADFVVTACASCGDVLTREYPRLFRTPDAMAPTPSAEAVTAFSRKVRDIHAFLADEVEFRAPGEVGGAVGAGGAAGAGRKAASRDNAAGGGRAASRDIAAARVVTIHDPCHLARGQGLRGEVRDLLSRVPGVTIREMSHPDTCCGGAGSFSLDHYDIAAAIRDRKVRDIEATSADLVVTGCPSCRMHISDGLEQARKGQPVRHLVDLVAAAYSWKG